MSQIRTERLENGNIRVVIPIVVRQTAAGKRIDAADEPQELSNRQALLLALARGRRWQRLIDDNEAAARRTSRRESGGT